ncbi:hypothetical protein K440DRAFT_640184 [Wilcoxina mikolae CBS 423.85]|nr:hypothetical protein K440DRAFT_640184 [Wilcoxina mikolae CBS 423.85]
MTIRRILIFSTVPGVRGSDPYFLGTVVHGQQESGMKGTDAENMRTRYQTTALRTPSIPTTNFNISAAVSFELDDPDLAVRKSLALYYQLTQIHTALSPGHALSQNVILTSIDTRLTWLDLRSPFNHTNFNLTYTVKPPLSFTESGSTFVPNPSTDKFYVFGGAYSKRNTSSPYYQEPPERNTADLWSYSDAKQSWQLETPNQTNVQRITDGAGTVDTREGVVYYAQGQYTNEVVRGFPGEQLPVDGLLSVHVNDPQPVWRNGTIPGGAAVVNGYLEYIPLGKRGVLISFGGARFPQGTFNGAWLMLLGRRVIRPWFLEAVHGQSQPGGASSYNDVWALLIPSFTWVKLFEGPESDGGFGHSCARSGPHLFMSGILRDNLCEPLFFIFDMVRFEWHSQFDPTARYEVPLVISDAIGGIPSGGAKRRTPLNGWSSKEVQEIFTNDPDQRAGRDGSKHETAKLGPHKVGGLVFGLFIIVAIAAGLYWLLVRKKWRPKWIPQFSGRPGPSVEYIAEMWALQSGRDARRREHLARQRRLPIVDELPADGSQCEKEVV